MRKSRERWTALPATKETREKVQRLASEAGMPVYSYLDMLAESLLAGKPKAPPTRIDIALGRIQTALQGAFMKFIGCPEPDEELYQAALKECEMFDVPTDQLRALYEERLAKYKDAKEKLAILSPQAKTSRNSEA